MADAQIVGWSHAPFGKREEPDTEALMASVTGAALNHAGLSAEHVDGIFVGAMNNGFTPQDFQGGLVAMGIPDLAHVPAQRLENACATGSAAIHAAANFIEAGRGKIALVVGVEKMTAVSGAEVGEALLGASYYKEEAGPGGFAGIFGRITENYFQRHGDQSEALAAIAAKNHANGVKNPYAHVRKDLGFEFCNTVSEKNPYVAGPLRRTDCSMVSDGAAALVLANAETAAELNRALRFRARVHVNDMLAMSAKDPIAFAGARRAWDQAKAEAGITLDDLDFVESHDCFTIAEMIEYEAMGLAEPGQGARVVAEGTTRREGKLPVNVSGGLKAKGHPIGATGVSMHVLTAMQLCGEAGEMQLADPKLGALFNMGGTAVANYVSVLERVK